MFATIFRFPNNFPVPAAERAGHFQKADLRRAYTDVLGGDETTPLPLAVCVGR